MDRRRRLKAQDQWLKAARLGPRNLNWGALGFSAFSAFLLLVAGCGGSSLDGRVEGVVTVAGKPLPCGTVVFYPVSGGPPAYGEIDAHGHYAAATGSQRGLPAGCYRVTVYAVERSPSYPKHFVPGPRLAPERFSDANRSGLSYTVKPGRNHYDIVLPGGV